MVGGTLFCVGCGEKVKIETKRKEKSKRMVSAMVPFDKTFPEKSNLHACPSLKNQDPDRDDRSRSAGKLFS
jgi:hypothetical protein